MQYYKLTGYIIDKANPRTFVTFKDSINVIPESNNIVRIFQFGQVRLVQGEDLQIVITKRERVSYDYSNTTRSIY